MSLWKEIEKLKFDKRLSEWHVARGKMSREELEKHLAGLPDSASNVDQFKLSEDGQDRGSANGGSEQDSESF